MTQDAPTPDAYAALTILAAGLAADPPPRQEAAIPSGTWAVLSSEQNGKLFDYPAKGTLYTFANGKVTGGPKRSEGKLLYTFMADPKKTPKEIDFFHEDGKKKLIFHCIYRIQQNHLHLCIGVASGDENPKSQRPTEFKSGPKTQLLTLEPAAD